MLNENVVYAWNYNENGEPCNLKMMTFEEYKKVQKHYEKVHMFEFLDRALNWGAKTFGETLLNTVYQEALERLKA